MILEIFGNNGIRAMLAFIIVIFVMSIYTLAIVKNNHVILEKLTQTITTIVAMIITFYFATELNG